LGWVGYSAQLYVRYTSSSRHMIRHLIFLIFLFTGFTALVYGQTNSFNCERSLLNKGDEFKVLEPKSLEGTYQFTIVPTWDPKAEKATVELHLFWEERYVALQADSMYTPLVYHPLIGYTIGDFQSATRADF